jgi:hypothetical protein
MLFFCWKGGFGLLVVSYRWIRWAWRFTWFRPPERNILWPRENRVVLLKSGLVRVSLSLYFFWPPEMTSTRAFYSSRSDSYNESQGPIGGLRAGKTLCCMAPPARSSKWCLQWRRYAWSCRLPHCTHSAVWRRAVASLGTVAVSDEWYIALALCYSRTVATHLTVLPVQSCWTTLYCGKPLWARCRPVLCWPSLATRLPTRLASILMGHLLHALQARSVALVT